jgi:hypothetical protein
MTPLTAIVFACRTPAPSSMFCAIFRYGTGKAEGMAGRGGAWDTLEVDQRPLQVAKWPRCEGERAPTWSSGATPYGAKSLVHLLGWQQTANSGLV